VSSQRTRDFLAWSARGACAGSGVDFFADGPEAVERAKAVCAACPVLEPCRAWGLLHERGGV
jgi:hypothetical protein